jgi:peptidoglycan/xylan/chitin deacetylase (PgdA/CDA1 family)
MVKKLLRSLTGLAEGHLPLKKLIGLTGEQIIMPFYHLVVEQTPPHIRHLYEAKNLKNFEDDLDYLLKHFKPLHLTELQQHVYGGKHINQPSFLLSFDDGLSSFYNVVAPVLERKGVPATCFLNPSFVDNKEMMYRYKVSLILDQLFERKTTKSTVRSIQEFLGTTDVKATLLDKKISDTGILDNIAALSGVDIPGYLEKHEPYMTLEQIRTLHQKGFAFGAHSMNHPLFERISQEEQVMQAVESVRWVQQNIGSTIPAFAFPFTDYGVRNETIGMIREKAGGQLLLFGTAGLKKSKEKGYFQRIPMEVPKSSAKDTVAYEYVYYILKNSVGRA